MSRYSDIEPISDNAFEIHKLKVRQGTELAYVREGAGGVPLLMLHGWPGTKRIFYRNIGPLADAGFEVIVPDISGWGDSPLGDRFADPTSAAHDFRALMEHLGHNHFVLVAFDFGSTTAMHMVNRFPESVIRQVIWNGMVPFLPGAYERAGVGGNMLEENPEIADHIAEHGGNADAVMRRLNTPEKRQEYIKGFYQSRVWKQGFPVRRMTAPESFDDAEAAFHARAFADETKFRASLNYYTAMLRPETCFEPPLMSQKVTTETMYLYGVTDQILNEIVTRRAEIGFTNLVGPFHVQGGGHFLSWERPAIVNSAIICFCRDLLARAKAARQRFSEEPSRSQAW
jgi:pimeloyl-ACP methyl ester carboxylesterase